MFTYCKNCTFWRHWETVPGAVYPPASLTVALCYRHACTGTIRETRSGCGCGDGEPRASDVPRLRSDCVEAAIRGHVVSALDGLSDHCITPDTIEAIVRDTMSCARSFQQIEDSRETWDRQHVATPQPPAGNSSGPDDPVDPDTAKDRR